MPGRAPVVDQLHGDVLAVRLDVLEDDVAVGEPVPEGEERSEARRLEEAVADEDALPVDDLALDARVAVALHAEAGRPVLHPGGEGHRQPPGGLGGARDDVGQRVGALFARVPGHEDGAGTLGPRHLDGGARVDDDDRAGVGLEDRLDELALAARAGTGRAGRGPRTPTRRWSRRPPRRRRPRRRPRRPVRTRRRCRGARRRCAPR